VALSSDEVRVHGMSIFSQMGRFLKVPWKNEHGLNIHSSDHSVKFFFDIDHRKMLVSRPVMQIKIMPR